MGYPEEHGGGGARASPPARQEGSTPSPCTENPNVTRPNSTSISVLLDRSGSMWPLREETVSAVNDYIASQDDPGQEVTFSLHQFDDRYQTSYEARPAATAPRLAKLPLVPTEDADRLVPYVPRGWTALHDALGRTIDTLGQRLASMPEQERPSKVLVVVVTDGKENASKVYTTALVRGMVEHQTGKYGWQFVFLGANQDAALAAGEVGISHGNALSFRPTGRGILRTSEVLARQTNKYRLQEAGQTENFFDGQKDAEQEEA